MINRRKVNKTVSYNRRRTSSSTSSDSDFLTTAIIADSILDSSGSCSDSSGSGSDFSGGGGDFGGGGCSGDY